MSGYTITHVWGIPIRVGPSLLIFLPVIVWIIGSGENVPDYAGLLSSLSGRSFDLAALQAGATPWLVATAAALGLFVSVTLHELGHSWVALRYDIEIESITLWVLGGIAALESVPKEWDRELWIAVAGPIVSVGVAAGCYAVMTALPASLPAPRFVAGWLALTNATLAGFNMLPAFPMDGGRVLRALLSRSRPYVQATHTAARIGIAFALLFGILGVVAFNPILVLLALFVYGAAKSESRSVMLDEMLDGVTVGDVMTRGAETVSRTAALGDLAERMFQSRQTIYPVVGDAGEVVGVVSLDDVGRTAGGDVRGTPVESVMADIVRVDPSADAFDTFSALARSGAVRAVVEEDGEVVGVLSEADLAHALSVRRGFGGGFSG